MECSPGIIRAHLTVEELRAALSGIQSWDEVFRIAPRRAHTGMHVKKIPAGTLVASVSDPQYSREAIASDTPLAAGFVSSFCLSWAEETWSATPQIGTDDRFERHTLVAIEPTDWLDAARILIHGLRSAKRRCEIEWAIVSSWETWQSSDLSWEARAKHLAARSKSTLSPNTLLNKCKRLGLRK
jgi:hypothetical protein